MRKRTAIVFDGTAWHVRRIRLIDHRGDTDEMVYRCDKPVSNDHASLAKVPAVRRLILAERKACAALAEAFLHNVRSEGGDALDQIARYSNGTVKRIAAAIRGRE